MNMVLSQIESMQPFQSSVVSYPLTTDGLKYKYVKPLLLTKKRRLLYPSLLI